MLKSKRLDQIHASESHSSISRSVKSAHSVNSRYRWPSAWAYIGSVMAFSCSIIYFDVLSLKYRMNDLSIFHFAAAFIFVGLPLYYLQILLGQYTQMGVTLIKYLSPIGHGVAISYIIIMYVNCVKNGLLLADVTIYFLSSTRSGLQWMQCPSNKEHCWNGSSTCKKNCLSETVRPSTYYYFVQIYMENAQLNPNTTKIIGIPSLSRSVLITASWILTSLLITLVYNFHQKIYVAMWNISFCLIVFNALTSLLHSSGNVATRFACLVNRENLLNTEIWARAVTKPVFYLGLGRAYHIVHGSYMSPNASSGIMASCLIAFSFAIAYLCGLFVRGRLLALAKFSYLDDDNAYVLWEPGIVTYFVNIPMSFGLLSLPHFWLLQYFLLCILLLLNNQVTHIITLEAILSEYFPALIRYKRYILGSLALSAGLISITLSSKETYLLYKSVSSHIMEAIEMLNALALSILVCYIYGVQRICDDIHFMKGAQPSNFWKICWYALPIILSFSQYQLSIIRKSVRNVIDAVDKWIFYIFVSPMPIVAIVEVFRYIRKRNILGLFQPEEMYGPPDPKERYLRRLFNPRKETRALRKSELCQHECLLNSKVLRRLNQEEIMYKQGTKDN